MTEAAFMYRELPVGTVLNNKYKIIDVLGQGGFGITYLASDLDTENKYAIKEFFPRGYSRLEKDLVIPSKMTNSAFESRLISFLNEAKILLSIEQENVVKVYSYFRENKTGYYVMEYVDGIQLEKYVKKYGPLDTKKALAIFIEICKGIEAIHDQGYLHGDIKPENIIINEEDEKIKIIDFGGSFKKGSFFKVNVISKRYSPPEKFLADSYLTPSSDIYSLGGVLFFMLSGTHPLSYEERKMMFNLNFPYGDHKTRNIIKKSMDQIPEKRYKSVSMLLKKIQPSNILSKLFL
jgi:serine/threonine-protein kinase